jgi:DnaJ-class molecular chaperone
MNSSTKSKKMTAYAAAAAAAGLFQVAAASSTPPQAGLSATMRTAASTSAPSTSATTASESSRSIHETLWGNPEVWGEQAEATLMIPRGGNEEDEDEQASASAQQTPLNNRSDMESKQKAAYQKKKKKRNSRKQSSQDHNSREGTEEEGDDEDDEIKKGKPRQEMKSKTPHSSKKSRSKADSAANEEDSKPPNPIMKEILQHENYYEILGLQRGESNMNAIKKAYRRRAVQTHPDKTGGDRRAFDMVAEAYDVLSDDEKRALYDRFGKAGLDPTAASGGGMHSAEDIFRNFFGGGNPFFGQQQRQQPRQTTNRTLRYQLEVSLEDLYRGLTRKVTVEAPPPMRGFYSYYQENPSKQVEVTIPRGSHAGQNIVLSGEMDFDSKDSPPGDLIFQLHQRSHKVYTRKGHDLALEISISLQEAICGFTRTIKHLDGRELLVESATSSDAAISAYIRSGDVQVLKGQGMPKNAHATEFGDLYVQFVVELPRSGSAERLSPSERIDLARLLEKFQGAKHQHGRGAKMMTAAANNSSSSTPPPNCYTLQPAKVSDFGTASGPVSTEDLHDDHHPHGQDHNGEHQQQHFPFGHRQFFFSSSGRSPFFGQDDNFEDDEQVQCRQM